MLNLFFFSREIYIGCPLEYYEVKKKHYCMVTPFCFQRVYRQSVICESTDCPRVLRQDWQPPSTSLTTFWACWTEGSSNAARNHPRNGWQEEWQRKVHFTFLWLHNFKRSLFCVILNDETSLYEKNSFF